MLSVRLQRFGRKKLPMYRIVVAEKKFSRDGRFVDIVGNYYPKNSENRISFNKEKVRHWISVGAQPTEVVHKLLKISDVL